MKITPRTAHTMYIFCIAMPSMLVSFLLFSSGISYAKVLGFGIIFITFTVPWAFLTAQALTTRKVYTWGQTVLPKNAQKSTTNEIRIIRDELYYVYEHRNKMRFIYYTASYLTATIFFLIFPFLMYLDINISNQLIALFDGCISKESSTGKDPLLALIFFPIFLISFGVVWIIISIWPSQIAEMAEFESGAKSR